MTESLNPPLRRRRRGIPLAALGLAALAVLGACGSDSTSSSDTTAKTNPASTAAGSTSAAAITEAPTTASSEPVTLRLGYFPNITHATALVGVEQGHLRRSTLGADVTLETSTFNAGTEASRRCSPTPSTSTYIGPNPAINAFAKSNGEACGSSPAPPRAAPPWSSSRTSTAPADLKGKKIATPQLGNTQDVALRYWLKEQG